MYRSIDSTKIRNLKVIAMIKQGQRLRTRTQFYSIDDYSLMTIYKAGIRYFTGESRTETIDAITRLIESCVRQAGVSESERKRLSFQLTEVLTGIKNLYITYKDDSTACAGLDYITELIEDFIVKHDSTYQRESITTTLTGDDCESSNYTTVDNAIVTPVLRKDPNEVDMSEEEIDC
jgi:hypothetical protein